jgi:hypothetical protein
LRRSDAIEPIDPAILDLGNTARNPSLIKDSDFKPLAAKSGSDGDNLVKSLDLLM